MKRRVLLPVVFLILSVPLTLWASGGKEPAAETVNLTFIHFWGGENPAGQPMRKAVDLYTAKYPAVKIKIEEYPTDDVYVPRLNADFAADTVPDVFISWPGDLSKPYVESKKLLDLAPYLEQDAQWKNSFLPGTIEQCKYAGFQGSVPIEGFTVPIFYNKELFSQYGVKAPSTYAEFVSAIDVFMSHGIVPLTAFIDNGWACALYWYVMANRIMGVAKVQAACRSGDFTDPGFVEAARRLLDFRNAKAFPENFIGSSNPEANNLFMTGKAAMYHHGTWHLANFQKNGPPGFLEKVGYFNFPSMAGGKGANTDWLSGVITSVAGAKSLQKDAARLTAGLALIKQISSAEVAKMLAEDAKRTPTIKTDLDEKKFGVLNKALLKDVASGTNSFTLHSLAVPPKMRRLIEDELTSLWMGKKTPEEAVSKIATSAQEAYK
jgi:raffinose/stachyose/melibiose transport system substrate-binding protein